MSNVKILKKTWRDRQLRKQSIREITYRGLLVDAASVHKNRKTELERRGKTELYYELTDKMDRIALLAQKKYKTDTEEFYNDMFNMIAKDHYHVKSLTA